MHSFGVVVFEKRFNVFLYENTPAKSSNLLLDSSIEPFEMSILIRASRVNMPMSHIVPYDKISEMQTEFWSIVGLNVLNMKWEIHSCFLQEDHASFGTNSLCENCKPISRIHIKCGIYIYS